MAVAYVYNQAYKRFVNKEITRTSLKVMLLLGATFDPIESSILTTLSAFEVSGNGWPVGGVAQTGTFNHYSESSGGITYQIANFFIPSTSIIATGGDIGPADALVVYDSTTSFPLVYIDFEGQITALVGTPFQVIWPSSRIIQFRALQ